MESLAGWLDVAVDILLKTDEETCLAVLARNNPAVRSTQVHLIEGVLTAEEALAYARVLFEMGRAAEGEELVRAVAFGQLGGGVVPQGEQHTRWLPETAPMGWQ